MYMDPKIMYLALIGAIITMLFYFYGLAHFIENNWEWIIK